VLQLLNLFSSDFVEDYKVDKGLEILNLDIHENKAFILNEISQYLFNTNIKSDGEKIFDLELDYKYYYIDFLKLGIDLKQDNISWWEFDSLLEGILLSKDSSIGQVLQYRTYKTPSKSIKTSENEENKFYLEKKRQYALHDPKAIDKKLEKMWSYVEKRAGGINE
jgi:hypothetical protein